MSFRPAAAIVVALAVLGLAQPEVTGPGEHHHRAQHGLQLENAWARRTPPMAQQEQGGHGGSAMNPHNSAVYVTIKNHGQEPDALVSATTPLATAVELHETIEQDGKRAMQPRFQFDLPKEGTLELKPGSYHLMLLGLKQALSPGDTVPVTLTFQKAGQISIDAPVK